MKRGGEVLGSGLSRYLSFFNALAHAYSRVGLTRAIARARSQSGVSKATVSRWLRDADVIEIGRRLSEPSRSKQLALGFPTTSREDESEVDHWPTPQRWKVLAECLRQYGERRTRPSPGQVLPAPRRLPVPSGTFLRLVVRARSIAAIRRGEPFPSWLDCAAPVAEPTRRFAFPSEWSATLSMAESPRRLLEDVVGPEWKADRRTRETIGEPWRVLRTWTRGKVLDGWRRISSPDADDEPDSGTLSWRDAERALGSVTPAAHHPELLRRFRWRVEAARRRTRPGFLRKRDEELEEPLWYWVRFDGQLLRVDVATRRRVVGAASLDVVEMGPESASRDGSFGPVWFHPVPYRERPDRGKLWLWWVGKEGTLRLEAPTGAHLAADRRR